MAEENVAGLIAQLTGSVSRLEEQFLLALPRYQKEQSLARHRGQMYSQNGEDGVIAEIFHRIGLTNREFVEIGAGTGQENCTRFPLECGWTGIWWEGSPKRAEAIRHGYASELVAGRLKLIDSFATPENAVEALNDAGCSEAFDLLSIDVDMHTSHIWKAVCGPWGFRPRVCVIEYNANVPPSIAWEVAYDAEARWRGDNLFGASLLALEKLGRELGYALVGCELTGINAYFVNETEVHEKVFDFPYTAEHHYEPPRLQWLTCSRGHPPSRRVAQ
jgi:hypothetical protein